MHVLASLIASHRIYTLKGGNILIYLSKIAFKFRDSKDLLFQRGSEILAAVILQFFLIRPEKFQERSRNYY